MKRLTTYYFLLLTGFNVLFAYYLTFVTANYKAVIQDALEGQALPLYTEWFCQYLWWPWAGVVVCVVGAMLSLWGKPKDNVLRTLLVIFLTVELLIMFVTLVAFHLPWVTL